MLRTSSPILGQLASSGLPRQNPGGIREGLGERYGCQGSAPQGSLALCAVCDLFSCPCLAFTFRWRDGAGWGGKVPPGPQFPFLQQDFERTPHLGPSVPHPLGPILGEGGSELQGLAMVRAGPAQGRTLSELQVSGAAGFTQSLPVARLLQHRPLMRRRFNESIRNT